MAELEAEAPRRCWSPGRKRSSSLLFAVASLSCAALPLPTLHTNRPSYLRSRMSYRKSCFRLIQGQRPSFLRLIRGQRLCFSFYSFRKLFLPEACLKSDRNAFTAFCCSRCWLSRSSRSDALSKCRCLTKRCLGATMVVTNFTVSHPFDFANKS